MKSGLTKEQIATRVAKMMKDGYYVNLGVGIPTLVADFLPRGIEVLFHSENGVLGFGPKPPKGQEDWDLINAGKEPVTEVPGTSYFHHADSFAMIRGGHVDMTVLGGLQVSEKGDLANWIVPGNKLGSIGGAMDLVSGAKMCVVTMEHTTKNGEPKILKECTYPLTGIKCVNLIVTNLALIEVTDKGLLLKEVAPGVTAEEVQSVTEPILIVPPELKLMEV